MDGMMRFPKGGNSATPLLGGSPAIDSTTGYPWADGDILYADDLNAAFLPMTGGELTGPLRVNFTNAGGTGGGFVYSSLHVNATAAATQNSGSYTWATSTILTDNAMQGNNNQNVGTASSIFKQGNSSTFTFFGQTIDKTGQVIGHIVGFEANIQANGPEPASTSFSPGTGNRSFYEIDPTTYQPPAWVASQPYAVGAAVQPTSANGFTYVCIGAGTSATTEPVWPTIVSGAVTDGTVAWQYGTTIAMQVSRAIGIGGSSTAQYATGILAGGYYYDAVFDLSGAHLVDGGVKDAGIRLAANMPIDFSGNLTDAGQNVRTLRWSSSTARLSYNVSGGVEEFSIADNGTVAIGGTPDFGFQLEVKGTNSVGIYTGGGAFSSAAIRMGADQKLSFIATDANYLQYRAATQRLYYVVNNVDQWSVDAGGNVRARGTVTGSTTP